MNATSDWVSEVLREEPDPTIPPDVTARITDALRAEVEHRAAGDLAADAKQAFDEVERRSSLGSFGTNAPAHYDRSGLGMRETTAL